jgi:glycosyltransferase involved in cell wall biosynthesis
VNQPSICVDARLITAPGIGTYLKNGLSHLQNTPWQWSALIGAENVGHLPTYITPIICSSKIYSVQEQIALPLKIPRVDLFWSPHYNVPCLPIRARKRLATIHDAFHLAHAATLGFAERSYAKIMMQAAMRLSDRIITDSEFSKSEIQKYTQVHRPMHVISLGSSSSLAKDSGSVLKKYGLGSGYLLYVGSFKAHKNLKGLIETFSLLVKRGWDQERLVIVGGGEGMRHCEDVKQLCIAHPHLQGKICFTGQVSDEELPHFYACAKLFVFPSFYEGFGLPPLEAMGAGCPTVVARSGAMPEVCGDGAVYVDPHSLEDMAFQLEALLSDAPRREQLSVKGRERAAQFSWKTCAERHCTLIEELVR